MSKNGNTDFKNSPEALEIKQVGEKLHALADSGELPESFFSHIADEMGKVADAAEKLTTLNSKRERKIISGINKAMGE